MLASSIKFFTKMFAVGEKADRAARAFLFTVLLVVITVLGWFILDLRSEIKGIGASCEAEKKSLRDENKILHQMNAELNQAVGENKILREQMLSVVEQSKANAAKIDNITKAVGAKK